MFVLCILVDAVALVAQNVYLFAASQNLAAWFHNCDKKRTAEDFKLGPEQQVLFAQTVGWPA
jgi:nitroreductase